MQPGQLEVNTPTLKNDRHFLLVDDKVSLEEDAENDPCDLHGQKKKQKNTEQHVRELNADKLRSGTSGTHQWRTAI